MFSRTSAYLSFGFLFFFFFLPPSPSSVSCSMAMQTPPSTLSMYLSRYWCVLFYFAHACPTEVAELRQICGWYVVRCKSVPLDRHPSRDQIVDEIVQGAGGRSVHLPALYVNKSLIGGVKQVRALESRKQLKDLLHFGFVWPSSSHEALGPLPPAYNDLELFRGRYRGAPKCAPVVQLPRLSPTFRE